MKKITLLNNQIETIKKYTMIKCIFTDNLIYKEEDKKINLYLYLNKNEYNEIYNELNNNLLMYDIIMFDETKHYDNYSFSRYIYENSLNINVYYLFDFEYIVKNNIISLHDPIDIIKNFNIQKLPLTNKNFAEEINNFCKEVYEFYNYYSQKEYISAYSKAKDIQDCFVLIYRGFYDSLNAKKHYNDLQSMNTKFYNNLLNLIKLFKYDTMIDSVQLMINEIDKMINQLPVNIITLFNFDFYTFTRKLIFSL